MNHTTGERVATAYSVDDRIDIVTFRGVKFFSVVNHGFPTIVAGREGFAQSRDDVFKVKLFGHLHKNAFVAFGIGMSTFHICVGFES